MNCDSLYRRVSGTLGRNPKRRLIPRRFPPHPGPLPWGEGESHPVSRPIQRYELITTWRMVLPLLKGEDWGEGERAVRQPGSLDFCNLFSNVGVRGKALASGLAVTLAFPSSVRACAACYGQSDSPMAAGMNWGIMSLMAVIIMVLGGVAAFFIYVAKRSSRATLLASPMIAASHDRSDSLPGRSDPHKHLVAGISQSVGRIGHHCAREKARSGTVIFIDGARQVVPGSSHSTL
jgi:hypothetical protein